MKSWANKTLSILAMILSMMSMVSLLHHGFNFGFTSVFRIMLNWYDAFAQNLIGWATPYIQNFLNKINEATGIKLFLYPHWKHVFILLQLYFGAHARSVSSARGKYATLFNVSIGLFLSFVAGIGSGLIPADNSNTSMLVAAFPVAAVAMYGFATSARAALYFRRENESFSHAFRIYGRHSIRILAFGTAAIIFCVIVNALPFFRLPESAGLILFFALIFSLAIYRISTGAWYAFNDRAPGQGWWERFHVTGFGTVGLLMLMTLFGTAMFIAGNAGLGLLGL